MAAPELSHLFTITVPTSLAAVIANGPAGTRVIVDAHSGTFTGDRLSGTVHGPGGDWVTMRADGSMLLDVRLLLKTTDGADIYMEYKGVGLPGAQHITTAPLFQTGHESYLWLNNVVGIARGATADGAVTYEVYEVC